MNTKGKTGRDANGSGGDARTEQAGRCAEEQRQPLEAALRESEERFRSMFNAAIGIAISTPLGRFVQANEAYCRMLGYTEEELRERDFASLTHPEDLTQNLKLRDEVLAGARESFAMEKRYLKKNGDIVWVHHSVSASRVANGEIKNFIVVVEDITERKRVEETLLWKTAFLEAQVNSSPDGMLVVDSNGMKILQNQKMIDIWNIPSEIADEADHRRRFAWIKSQVKNPSQEIFAEKVAYLYAHPDEVSHDELELVGGKIIDRYSASVKGSDGKYYGRIWIYRDITKQKRIEARFRRLVESNAQAVFFWNTKGEITDGNDAFLKITGYTREELVADRINWVAMTPPEYNDSDQLALKELVATGICTPYEKEWIRKDGRLVPILVGAAVFEDNPEEGVMFVFDLTDRKKLEMQFRQAQKMESIGTLAGGVSHDFNNILGVIQMQTDLFKTEGQFSPAQLEYVEAIDDATRRAAALTRQLLMFSRKEIMHLRDLDLDMAINDMANMLRRILGEDIQLQFKFSMQPLFIRADPGMIDQVLMNLAVNSRDAMPRGGRLVIETSAVEFDETISAQSAQARPGSFVCLSVSDNGCGIPPENLSRIFEPFFTTKEVGKGTGLGLATLFGIVQQHKGWVNVYSEVGQGTTFRIYLPRLAGISLHKLAPIKPTSPHGGTETILFVEDDAFLRPTICQTLSRLGYRVLAASNGAEALEIWKQHRDEIRLLLTDMVMPGGMTGKELGQRLLQENPKLKVIYASGYSAEVVSGDFQLEEGVNFLTKPFQAAKLAKTIRDNLDARP